MNEKPSLGLRVARGKGLVGSIPLPPGTRDATLPRPALPDGVVPLHPDGPGLQDAQVAQQDAQGLLRRRD